MYQVYAVQLKLGIKNRYYIGETETLDGAKHLANCVQGADYCYVKEQGATVFFLRNDPNSYDLRPIDRSREAQVHQIRASQEL